MLRHYFSDVSGAFRASISIKTRPNNEGFSTTQALPDVELAENEYLAMLDENGKVNMWPDKEDSSCTWQVKTRLEKVTAYSKGTKESKQFDDKTLVPDDYTLKQPLTLYHTFSDLLDDWELTAEGEAKQLTDVLQLSINAIDNESASVTAQWSRFAEEYKERGSAALAYREAEYTGEASIYITSFATPAGMSNQSAADLILKQADDLRALQSQLAAERMRKYELKQPALTLEEITALRDEIVANIKALGESYE